MAGVSYFPTPKGLFFKFSCNYSRLKLEIRNKKGLTWKDKGNFA
jgi:hypothetical protein